MVACSLSMRRILGKERSNPVSNLRNSFVHNIMENTWTKLKNSDVRGLVSDISLSRNQWGAPGIELDIQVINTVPIERIHYRDFFKFLGDWESEKSWVSYLRPGLKWVKRSNGNMYSFCRTDWNQQEVHLRGLTKAGRPVSSLFELIQNFEPVDCPVNLNEGSTKLQTRTGTWDGVFG